jgi:hypothetical protein
MQTRNTCTLYSSAAGSKAVQLGELVTTNGRQPSAYGVWLLTAVATAPRCCGQHHLLQSLHSPRSRLQQ